LIDSEMDGIYLIQYSVMLLLSKLVETRLQT